MAAEVGVAYVRYERVRDEGVSGEGASRRDCRRAMRGACDPEARVSLARERVRDAADMLRGSVERKRATSVRSGAVWSTETRHRGRER